MTSLDVQRLNALTDLVCSKNQLSSLKVHDLKALQSLDCSDNRLASLDIQGFPALENLTCSGNRLSSLNVQNLNALSKLDCSYNQLNAHAFTTLFNNLPPRSDLEYDSARCYVYGEVPGKTENNCKNFSSPENLKTAFEKAKTVKKWEMLKWRTKDESEEL